jgi:hypothetical protein
MAFFKARNDTKEAAAMAVQLPVAFIEEGDEVVAYTPALDLATSGSDHEEAKRMFEELVRIFFKDLVENGTLHEVLTGLGWTRGEKQSAWLPPRISQESIGVQVPISA